MRRLLIITEYFYPDTASGTGRVMTEMAEDLAKAGFAVDVVCGQPSYLRHERVAVHEKWQGISIARLSELNVSRHSGIGRAISWLWFMVQCLVRLPVWARTHDSLLIVTNPAPALVLGWLFKRRHPDRVYVALVHDLFPENAIAVGKASSHSALVRLMKRMNRLAFDAADHIIVLGEDMKRLVCADYQVLADKVRVIPNWAEVHSESSDDSLAENWRRDLKLDGKFVVLYAGNFGFAQDADLIIRCLVACRDMDDVVFVFAGGGGQYAALEEVIVRKGLGNVVTLPYQEGSAYVTLLDMASTGLVSLRSALRGTAVPSKVMAYMAAGIPVVCIATHDSDLARLVEGAGVGLACDNPESFRQTAQYLIDNRAVLSTMSARALVLAKGTYSRTVITSEIVALLR